MKKLAALIVSVMTLFCYAVFSTACGGEAGTGSDEGGISSGDTFVGAISEESYSSDEAAVEAFLEREISGDATQAELVGFKAKKDLGEKQIAELETGDVLGEGDEIVGAKEVEVTYKRTSATASLAAALDDDEETFLFTVYILEVSPAGATLHVFHYYVPKAKNGDVLTRSYYEDLLDEQKYLNCTQVYSSESTIKATYGGQSQSMSGKNEFTIMVADGKASVNIHMFDPDSLMLPIVTYTDVLAYCEQDGEVFSMWTSLDEGTTWSQANNILLLGFGLVNMESFATMNIPKIDYSFYEKTSYGFKIQEDFLNQYLGQSAGALDPNSSVEAELKIYVSDGRIAKMEASNSVKSSMSGTSIVTTTKELLEFKNYGTTTVTRPASISTDSDVSEN